LPFGKDMVPIAQNCPGEDNPAAGWKHIVAVFSMFLGFPRDGFPVVGRITVPKVQLWNHKWHEANVKDPLFAFSAHSFSFGGDGDGHGVHDQAIEHRWIFGVDDPPFQGVVIRST